MKRYIASALALSAALAAPADDAALRNIAVTAPYFHSGKVWDLKVAVDIMAESQLGEKLDEATIDDITAFLGTLTGEQPQVVHPTFPVSTATTPKPAPM